jgi:PAS domain-containing protein
MSFAALVLELNMLVALLGGGLALQRRASVPGRRSYAGLAFAAAAWCGGELLIERGFAEATTGMRLAMLGITLIGPFWLGSAVQLAGLPVARRLPWLPVGLAIPGFLVMALLFADPWSALVLRSPREPGPLWWVYLLYTYALVAVGAAIHLRTGLRAPRGVRRWQRIAIGLAGLVPLAAHVAYTWSGFAWPLDPTPLTLTPIGVAMASALFPGGLIDVRPAAQQELIAHLPIGVVMADRRGAVIDVNPHAERALALRRDEALGRALDALVAEVPRSYRVEISEVQRSTRVIARFAFLVPPEMQGDRPAGRRAKTIS